MKKLFALVMVLCMAFSFVACAAPAAEEAPVEEAAPAEETPAALTYDDYAAMSIDELKGHIATVSEGMLTVATSPDFAPYEFYVVDENGEYALAGFDMSLAEYIANYLGLELEVVPMDFDGTLAELAAKNVDLSLAGYSPDPARMDKMDFSVIYYEGGQSFVTIKGKEANFATLEDTNKADWTIGAQNGSIQMDLANENSPEADIVPLTKVTDIIAELLAGTLDGAYIETAVAETYAISYPELAIVLDVPYEAEGSAVGVSKDNFALLAGVNMAVEACLADGSMAAFVAEANELSAGNIGILVDGEIVEG